MMRIMLTLLWASKSQKEPKRLGKINFTLILFNREVICMVQGKDPNEGYQTEQVEEEEIPMPTYENL